MISVNDGKMYCHLCYSRQAVRLIFIREVSVINFDISDLYRLFPFIDSRYLIFYPHILDKFTNDF